MSPRAGRRGWARAAGWGVGALGLLAVMGGLAVWCLNYFPRPLEPAWLDCGQPTGPGGRRATGAGGRLRPGQRFRLLSWNIQYGAGRGYHFFYDGGPDVHADWITVQRTMEAVSEVIRREDPDLLLLQEVDRGSARTARIDELRRLRRAGDLRCWASAPYHRSRFVPVPLRRPLGRVDMHLATASRFPMAWARRRALPLLREPALRRAFNLKRAVLETAVPVEGGGRPLVLLNTHLSAFSFGDGTLERQVDVIWSRLRALEASRTPWILAGDFNLLPPDDDPARLGEAEARHYPAGRSGVHPLARLLERFGSGVDPGEYHRDPARYYTYLPWGADAPDRRIDYVFVSDQVKIHRFETLRLADPPSDHLPLVLEAEVR